MDWLGIKEFLKDFFKVIIVILAIIIVLEYLFSITQVVGDSMNPTLKNGELLVLNKIHYRFNEPKRNDVISLKYADTKYLIKRVIGLPGENIYIKDSKLYINDALYEESYLEENIEYEDFYLRSLGYDKIPDGMYLVLGDNRENSMDSREIGFIKKEDILGKITIRLWPINKLKIIK